MNVLLVSWAAGPVLLALCLPPTAEIEVSFILKLSQKLNKKMRRAFLKLSKEFIVYLFIYFVYFRIFKKKIEIQFDTFIFCHSQYQIKSHFTTFHR